MNYSINFENYKNNFSLPSVIASSLTDCNAEYLKVILTLFANPDKHYSVSLLADLLALPESTVVQCIRFWIQKGVLRSEHRAAPKIEILRHEKAKPMTCSDQSELSYLISHMETTLQRSVSSTDIKTITHIFETYRLPTDVLLMAIQYAVKRGHKDIRYIERLCVDWYDRGIVTHSDAERFLINSTNLIKYQNEIQRLFGIDNRKLIPREKQHIERWFAEYHFSLELIKLAFERTIHHTGKIAFAYINKILQNWHEKGFTSVEDVVNSEKGTDRKLSSDKSYDIEVLDNFWDKIPKLD